MHTTVEIANKSAVLDMSMVGYGEHSAEVRLYPEVGEYISKTLEFRVADPAFGDTLICDFEDYIAGEVPSKLLFESFRDINGAAVHPISNYLAECDNDAERVLTMLGQVVVLGTAECEFKTDNGEQCKRTKAVFARMLTDYKGYKIW